MTALGNVDEVFLYVGTRAECVGQSVGCVSHQWYIFGRCSRLVVADQPWFVLRDDIVLVKNDLGTPLFSVFSSY